MNAAVPEASLQALFQLLTEQAMLSMGIAHPMMKEVPPANPQLACFFVDLLALLQDKTEGRRTEAESRDLEARLFQLRMRVFELKSASANPQGGTK